MSRTFVFPADIPGWLSEKEGGLLYAISPDKVVLEVGSYCGKSTICLAQSAARVVSVDPHDMRGVVGPKRDTWREFLANVAPYRERGLVVEYRMTLEDFAARKLYDPADGEGFHLAFIDTDHNYRTCRRHAALCASLLAPGGLLAFHDYGREGDEEVTICVDGILAAGGRLVRALDSGEDHLAVIDPAGWRKCT